MNRLLGKHYLSFIKDHVYDKNNLMNRFPDVPAESRDSAFVEIVTDVYNVHHRDTPFIKRVTLNEAATDVMVDYVAECEVFINELRAIPRPVNSSNNLLSRIPEKISLLSETWKVVRKHERLKNETYKTLDSVLQ